MTGSNSNADDLLGAVEVQVRMAGWVTQFLSRACASTRMSPRTLRQNINRRALCNIHIKLRAHTQAFHPTDMHLSSRFEQESCIRVPVRPLLVDERRRHLMQP